MTFIVDGTNGGFFPSWTTATRPASPAVGQMGYNTTTGAFDAYTSAGWTTVYTSGTTNLAGNGPAFSAYGSALQSVSNSTFTKIAFNTEEFDTANCFDSTTNYRFTPTVAGYYQFNATIGSAGNASGYVGFSFYKNGSRFKDGAYVPNTNLGPITTGSALIYLNGSTDYVEIYGFQNSGGSLNIGSPSSSFAFSGSMVRVA